MTDEEMIEIAARALCKADGGDPSGEYQTTKMEVITTSNSSTMGYSHAPNWEKYRTQAKQHVAVWRAFKKIDT